MTKKEERHMYCKELTSVAMVTAIKTTVILLCKFPKPAVLAKKKNNKKNPKKTRERKSAKPNKCLIL